jgi:hypothetical protein
MSMISSLVSSPFLSAIRRLLMWVANDVDPGVARRARYRLFTAFACFGLLNNGEQPIGFLADSSGGS